MEIEEAIEKMLDGEQIVGEEVGNNILGEIEANDRLSIVDYAEITWGPDTHTLYLIRVDPDEWVPEWYYILEDTEDGHAIIDGPYDYGAARAELRAEVAESTIREIEKKIANGERVGLYAWNTPASGGNGCAGIELYRGKKGTLRAKVWWGVHPRKWVSERPVYYDAQIHYRDSDDDYDYGAEKYRVPPKTVVLYRDAVVIGGEKLSNWEVSEDD